MLVVVRYIPHLSPKRKLYGRIEKRAGQIYTAVKLALETSRCNFFFFFFSPHPNDFIRLLLLNGKKRKNHAVPPPCYVGWREPSPVKSWESIHLSITSHAHEARRRFPSSTPLVPSARVTRDDRASGGYIVEKQKLDTVPRTTLLVVWPPHNIILSVCIRQVREKHHNTMGILPCNSVGGLYGYIKTRESAVLFSIWFLLFTSGRPPVSAGTVSPVDRTHNRCNLACCPGWPAVDSDPCR